MGALSLTGDVIAGGAALAGLILVYLGNVATIFGIYEKTQQHAVRKIYQRRAWFAFAGVSLAILASGLALAAKWIASGSLASASIVLLFLALIWAAIASFLIALEVK